MKTCFSCSHFLGGGDWGLCCDIRDILCYFDTEACNNYEKVDSDEQLCRNKKLLLDENGNYTNPRIAIKMKHKNEFNEIRGVGPNQNLEEGFELVLVNKLNEFDIDDDTKRYWVKLSLDSRELTRLLQKTKRKEKLALEEIRFVFLFPKNEEFRWNNYEKLERIKSTLVITDRALLLDAVKHYEDSLRHASEDLKNDKDLMIEVVKQNNFSLKYVPEKFRNDKEFMSETLISQSKNVKH